MQRLFFLLALFLIPSVALPQYYTLTGDFQDPDKQFTIPAVFSGNTPFLRYEQFERNDPWSFENTTNGGPWTMYFRYSYGQYDTNGMVTLNGTISSNVVTFGGTNVLFQTYDYYFSIFGINLLGQQKTFARGIMHEKYDPASGTNVTAMIGQMNLSWWSNNIGLQIVALQTGKLDRTEFSSALGTNEPLWVAASTSVLQRIASNEEAVISQVASNAWLSTNINSKLDSNTWATAQAAEIATNNQLAAWALANSNAIAAETTARIAADTNKVAKTGDTISGNLTNKADFVFTGAGDDWHMGAVADQLWWGDDTWADAMVKMVFDKTNGNLQITGDYIGSAAQLSSFPATLATTSALGSEISARIAADTNKVAKTGDTMTGVLTVKTNISINAGGTQWYIGSAPDQFWLSTGEFGDRFHPIMVFDNTNGDLRISGAFIGSAAKLTSFPATLATTSALGSEIRARIAADDARLQLSGGNMIGVLTVSTNDTPLIFPARTGSYGPREPLDSGKIRFTTRYDAQAFTHELYADFRSNLVFKSGNRTSCVFLGYNALLLTNLPMTGVSGLWTALSNVPIDNVSGLATALASKVSSVAMLPTLTVGDLSSVGTNLCTGFTTQTGTLGGVKITNIYCNITGGKVYAWGLGLESTYLGTSWLSCAGFTLTNGTPGSRASNYFSLATSTDRVVLTISSVAGMAQIVTNVYVCEVRTGTVWAAGDIYLGGNIYGPSFTTNYVQRSGGTMSGPLVLGGITSASMVSVWVDGTSLGGAGRALEVRDSRVEICSSGNESPQLQFINYYLGQKRLGGLYLDKDEDLVFFGAGSIVGNASGLTNLNGAQILSGNIPTNALTNAVSLLGLGSGGGGDMTQAAHDVSAHATNYVPRTGGNIVGNIVHTGDYTQVGNFLTGDAGMTTVSIGASDPVTNISSAATASGSGELMFASAIQTALSGVSSPNLVALSNGVNSWLSSSGQLAVVTNDYPAGTLGIVASSDGGTTLYLKAEATAGAELDPIAGALGTNNALSIQAVGVVATNAYNWSIIASNASATAQATGTAAYAIAVTKLSQTNRWTPATAVCSTGTVQFSPGANNLYTYLPTNPFTVQMAYGVTDVGTVRFEVQASTCTITWGASIKNSGRDSSTNLTMSTTTNMSFILDKRYGESKASIYQIGL